MSKYTTELRYILNGAEENVSDMVQLIDDIRPFLFDFSYPSSHMTAKEKESLEKHFIMHYLYNEIGFETAGAFKNRLQSKFLDIMPRYDALYESMHLDLNMFDDFSVTTITETKNNVKSKGTNNTTNSGEVKNTTNTKDTNLSLSSDTPQTNIDINSVDYVSAINKTTDKSENISTSTNLDKSDGTSENTTRSKLDGNVHTFGNNGDNLGKMKKYRDLIINIELEIINECRNLFMLIW